MRMRILLSLASVGLLMLAADADAAAQNTQNSFRWRGAQGTVHYSNLLPPSAVDRGYEVLNGSGEIVKRVPPPLTAKQRAAAEAEAKRLEKQARVRAAQARRDNMLLRTFNSVKGIENLRDSRLAALDSQLRLVQDHVRQLETSLKSLHQREANVQKMGRPISPGMRREGQGIDSELADARATLHSLQAQRASIKRRFQSDIARFKQLQAEGRVQQ